MTAESLRVPVTDVDEGQIAQLEYSLAFIGDDVSDYQIDPEDGILRVELAPGADRDDIRQKIARLIERYAAREFGFKEELYFEQEAPVVNENVWQQLLERKWVTEVGQGHVVLRGGAARLLHMIDNVAVNRFAVAFGAETEVYPATIQCTTLDQCNHFTSFPEHLDFVAPLQSDIDVLKAFADDVRNGEWSSNLHEERMATTEFAISPSCCYHCYEGMAGWDLRPPGRCVTAILGCHRYEGMNHRTLSRLRAFTMREVIWVGHPKFVIGARAKADGMIVELARRWGLHCSYEVANDMFFTKDYAVKASFQRQQEAKKELRLIIPQEDTAVSVISSNFHAGSFGSAFDITVGGRPAVSACIGFGLERFAYAILSQFGLDPDGWPEGLRRDYQAFRSQ